MAQVHFYMWTEDPQEDHVENHMRDVPMQEQTKQAIAYDCANGGDAHATHIECIAVQEAEVTISALCLHNDLIH